MKYLNLLLVVFLVGCSLIPDESSIWGSYSPRDSSFNAGSISHQGPRGHTLVVPSSNFFEFEQEDLWTVGVSITYYFGKSASRWKGQLPSPEALPTPGLGGSSTSPSPLPSEGPEDALRTTVVSGGTVVNVVVPDLHHEPVAASPEPEVSSPRSHTPPVGSETAGILRLYLEADWVTQAVVGCVAALLLGLMVVLVVLRGPALISAWKGWRARQNGAEDPKA